MKSAYRYNKINNTAFVSKILVVIFIISLIPIIAVSFYTHPIYDDYHYSAALHNHFVNNKSIFQAPKVVLDQVIKEYLEWQGSYSSILMFQLQPGIISQDAYFLTTFLLMFVLIVGELSILKVLIVKVLNCKKSVFILFSFIILLYKIQFIHRAYDAFYWYNGSIYYTFFYGMSLLMFTNIIKMIFVNKKKSIISTLLLMLLAFFVAGGSYVSALPSTFVLCLLSIYCFKNKKETKMQMLFVSIVFIAGFIISLTAPGNKVRGSGANQLTAVQAVYESFIQSAKYIHKLNSNSANILLWISTLPFLYSIAKSSSFSFKYPILVIVFSYCLYTCQWTPSLYGTGIITGARQWNVFFYNYYWLIGINLFYILGYFSRKDIGEQLNTIYHFMQKHILPCAIAFALLFLICAKGKNILTWSTINALKGEDLKKYDAHMDSTARQLENSDKNIEYIDVDVVRPEIFDNPFLYKERGNWNYIWMGEYYNIEEVVPVSKYN